MTGFSFNSVQSILVEDGAAARLGEIVKERFNPDNVMLVTDKCLVELGLVAPVVASLEASGIAVAIFDDVEADPSEETVSKAALFAKSYRVTMVIGFGGGSSMDVAKLVAFLGYTSDKKGPAANAKRQYLSDMYGVDKITDDRLPLVQVPTTSGTGSEVTAVSVVTTGETTKKGVASSKLLADLAVLDATLTVGLPKHITAATGIDAMVHAIEAYTTKLKKNPVSDAMAKQALTLLGGNLLTACNDGSNLDARRAMLTGAMLAGASFANAPVAGVHALAYPLGGHFHIPHGHSNALVLPHVLKFNAPYAEKLYAELADHMGLGGVTDAAKTEAFIAWLEGLADAVGIETRLRDMGIKESDLAVLADDAMLQGRLLVNNPRELTRDDALAIYEAAW